MAGTSKTVGAVSGCAVWAIVAALLATCLVPVACVFTLFTSSTELAARVVGPLVCPAGATATVERGLVSYVDDDGFTREAMGAEIVCVNAQGTVVARPAPLPNWLWSGLVSVAALVLAGGLAVLLAAPAGLVISRMGGRAKPA